MTGTALTTYPFAAINSIGTHAGNVLLSIANGDIRVLDPVSGATVRSYANFQTIILDALASSVGNRVVAVSNDQHFQNRWGAVFSFCGGPTECGPCETCDASGACVAAPHPTCRALTSGRSTLVVKDMTPNDKDRVLWKIGGAFPDPPRNSPGFAFGFPDYALGENDYTLCMYDESTLTPSVVFRATAPVAGDCGGSPCWKAVRYGVFGDVSGYTYLDREQTPHGLEKILLRTTGGGGSLRLKVQGKGDNLSSAPLGMVTPPFNLPLRVQLHNRYGSCWEATYPAARRNVPGQFRATASTP